VEATAAIVKSAKLLVLCPFPEGVAAGQRLKYEQYFGHWRQQGYEITVSPFMDMAMWRVVYTPGNYCRKIAGTCRGYVRRLRDLFSLRAHDIVYVFMWATPMGTSGFERAVRRLSRKVIFDVEDNVFLERGSEHNRFVKALKSREKTRYLIRKADHVITSSPFLNDYCMSLNEKGHCTYVSSSVDTDRFVPANRYSNDGPITIGWTGTFSSRPYLDLLRPVFLKLLTRIDFKLRVIGNFAYSLPGVNLELIQWTKEREVKDLQGIDIGVYPLTEDEWVFGKSGLKAIQYMAFGIPTVATNIGTTPQIIDHMHNGWLVRTEQEWLEAIETLTRDGALRRRLGEAARRKAVENYSLQAIKIQYLSILDGLRNAPT
jgi:glycosyltransferase involved in cell wall biosynthesis